MKLFCCRYILPILSPALEQGGMAVDQGRIVAVGPAAELRRRYPHAEEVNLGEGILLPALVNAHTHLELSDFPQWAAAVNEPPLEQGGFTDWLLRLIRVKIARRVSGDDSRQSWLHGVAQSLRSGSGVIGDILSESGFYATVAEQLPGRCYIEVLGHDPIRVHNQWQNLDHCLEHWPTSQWGAAPHAPYTISDDLLAQSYRYTSCRHLPTTIHVAESADEVEFLHQHRGPMVDQFYPFVGWTPFLDVQRHKRPLACLEQAGALRPDTLLVHGVHLNREEIATVARAGCSMALCPRSNAQLNCGVAPVADYLAAGVNLALGTDSLASNDSLSIWDEMAFARDWFSGDLSADQLLYMATLGGAKAMGLDDLGCLAPGCRATFQLLEPEQLPERDQLVEFLCSAERSNDVSLVVIDGHIRYDQTTQEGR
jgi:cytosine/adenosine deaminase-related metal-dependent hydrolase